MREARRLARERGILSVILLSVLTCGIYGLVVIMNVALRVGATVVTLPRFEMKARRFVVEDRG